MRAKALAALVALVILHSSAWAQAPVLEVHGPQVVEVGRKIVVQAETTAKKVTWKVPAGCDSVPLDGKRLAVWALPGTYTFTAMVPNGDDVVAVDVVLTVTGPRPPPNPPGPVDPPTPVDPVTPPVVVKSFRVIFVKESGATLPAGQSSIPAAKAIRDYLAAKTTPEGGIQGWREYDPQSNVANEQPTMKALWAAVKPKITAVPCVVVEVNGKADIVPFPADAATALKLLKTYGGE